LDELWFLAVGVWPFWSGACLQNTFIRYLNQIPRQRGLGLSRWCAGPLASILRLVQRIETVTVPWVKAGLLVLNLVVLVDFTDGSVILHALLKLRVIHDLLRLHLSHEIAPLRVFGLWHFKGLNSSARGRLEKLVFLQDLLAVQLLELIYVLRW